MVRVVLFDGIIVCTCHFCTLVVIQYFDAIAEQDKIMLAAGAASNAVFDAATNVVGVLPDATLYFDRIGRVIRSQSVKKIYVVEENEEFTTKACSPITSAYMSGRQWYGMDVAARVVINSNSTKRQREKLYENELIPAVEASSQIYDALFGCLYVDTCLELIDFLRDRNLDVSALLFTTCVHESSFRERLLSRDMRQSGFPGRYIVGSSMWDSNMQKSTLDPIGSTPIGLTDTGTDVQLFIAEFKGLFDEDPSYHSTAAFALLRLSVLAINTRNSTAASDIRNFLEGNLAQTAFGRIRYDGGQNAINDGALALQHDEDRKLQVVSPDFAASEDLVFPKPEWRFMICVEKNKCGDNGECNADGSCNCNHGYIGSTCSHNLLTILASTLSVVIFLTVATLFFFGYRYYTNAQEKEKQEKESRQGQAMALVAQQTHLRALSFINHRLRNPTHSMFGTIYILQDNAEFLTLPFVVRDNIELLKKCVQQVNGTLDEISGALDTGGELLANAPSIEDDNSSLGLEDTDSVSKGSSSPSTVSEAEDTFMLSDIVRDIRYNIESSAGNIRFKTSTLTVPTMDEFGKVKIESTVDLVKPSNETGGSAALLVGKKSSLMQLFTGLHLFTLHKLERLVHRIACEKKGRYSRLVKKYKQVLTQNERRNCACCLSKGTVDEATNHSEAIMSKMTSRPPFEHRLTMNVSCHVIKGKSGPKLSNIPNLFEFYENLTNRALSGNISEVSSVEDGHSNSAQSGFWIVWEAKICVENFPLRSSSTSEDGYSTPPSRASDPVEQSHSGKTTRSRKTRKKQKKVSSEQDTLRHLAGECLASYMPLIWSTDKFDKRVGELGGTYRIFLPDATVLALALVIQDQIMVTNQHYISSPGSDFPLDSVTGNSVEKIMENIVASRFGPGSAIGGIRVSVPMKLSPQSLVNTGDESYFRYQDSISSTMPPGFVPVNDNDSQDSFRRSASTSDMSSIFDEGSLSLNRSKSYEALNDENRSRSAGKKSREKDNLSDRDSPIWASVAKSSQSTVESKPETSDLGNNHQTTKSVTTTHKSVGSYHFLVVDDESTNRLILKRMLLKSGPHKVTLAKDGKEVLPLLKRSGQIPAAEGPPEGNSEGKMAVLPEEHTVEDLPELERFDAILLDIVMHEMNGDEACQRLRKKGCTLPIIATTGNASKQDATKYKVLGFNDILHKPFNMKALHQSLEGVGIFVGSVSK